MLEKWNLRGKKVFLRIDGNVSIRNGLIENDFRLRSMLPTLELLKSKGGIITIATHLGRPKSSDKKFSTKPIKNWFENKGYKTFSVLENLRFDERENQANEKYAKELAGDNEYYVNDAWGVMHREDTSITTLPKIFPEEKRALGLLVRKEIKELEKLKKGEGKPYLVILGGKKIASKLPAIERLINNKKPTTIFLLPGIVFTFLHAMGKITGKSLVDEKLLKYTKKILQNSRKNSVKLLFPEDIIFSKNYAMSTLHTSKITEIPKDGIGVSIGPISLNMIKKEIEIAKMIFYNGAMGFPEYRETMKPLHKIFEMIKNSNAYSVIGGGDSVAEIENLNFSKKINFCSTGGGSTLAYISDGKMPGLEIFKK